MININTPIKTPNGVNYLTAVNGGGLGQAAAGKAIVAIQTDRTVARSWETFKLILVPAGQAIGPGMTFALQALSGQYVTAVNGGGIGGPNDGTCPIHTDAVTPRQWEQFTFLIDDSANPPTVQIKTVNGTYLTAVNGGGVGDAAGGDAATPVRTGDTEVLAWQKFSLPVQPQSQAYTFTLPKFTCNKMRSNNFLGTERDTDYASMSIIVNSGAPQTVTQSMGNVDSNSSYATNLRLPSIQIADTDNVIIQYHIINSSSSLPAALAILEQAGEKIGSAAVQAIASAAGGAIGAALGTILGLGVPVPLIGSALGALAGFVVGVIWGQLDANCDGPVAAAVHIYNGAQLRVLTSNGPFTASEDNPGADSPAGCGSNSDYVVEWSVLVA